MDRRTLLTASAAAVAALTAPGCSVARPERTPVTPPDATPASSLALARFGGALLAHLPTDANAVLSPWSIAMVLAMVREGAVGATASELDAALGVPAPGFADDLAANARLLTSGRATIRHGNALWGHEGMAWKEPFLARLDETFGAPLHRADFRANAEAARVEINAWVSSRTAGKIPELLTRGLLNDMTRLVLVNAVHVKAPWDKPLTELGRLPFTTASGDVVDVETLSGGGTLPWLATDALRATALPCEGGEVVLVVALPTHPAAAVDPSVFADVVRAPTVPVSLQLPAWTFTHRLDLVDALRQVGVRLAFDPDGADFSAMTDSERLHVGFVVHEATIEVNAKGIEAAAATAAGMEAGSAPGAPERLVLDRPFTYALVHVATATPLFVGRLTDPSQR